MKFTNSFRSEWLKKKRSLASWLVIGGAFFTPSIILASHIKNADKLPELYASDDFWQKLWTQTWESMAVFLLPFGIILATALITQIEYKNNTWKQLHTTPQGFTTIFFAKFLVILVMLVEVFVLFNVGMYLSAVIPSLVFSSVVPYPTAPIPFMNFLNANVNFFLDCLPILAFENTRQRSLENKSDYGGLGNELIQKRLMLIYPDKHSLEIADNESVYRVKLTLL